MSKKRIRGTTILDKVTADSVVAAITGAVTGNVVGNVTGNLTGNVTGNVTGLVIGGEQNAVTVASGDGAIAVKTGTVVITKGSAAALTLAAPTVTTDDGKILRIVSTTGYAHVITGGVVGFNAKGSSGTATLGTAKGDGCTLIAYQGNWYSLTAINCTFA